MEGALGPGTVLLGKYRVESVLGRGGMGVVLKVTHLQLGEELAVKVLLPEGATSPEVTARFLREAQSVVRLRGEHVARVSDIGVLPEGLPFIVMEYLRGVDLAGELKRRRELAPGEAVDYVLQACEALAEAHAHGIVHRDIKPANLFLTTRPDGTPLVKVLDFGISKAPITASGVVTRTDTVMGTAGYMSPEQMKAARDVDARTDIWALGIVLYECLNGRRPFEGESFSAVVLMAGTEPPPPMDPRLPRALQAAVLRCLEKDRRARFSSIAELAAALAPFARDQRAAAMVVDRTNLMRQRPGSAAEPPPPDHVPTVTTLSGSAGPVSSRSRRRRYFAGVLSFLGAAVLLSVAGLLISGSLHGGDTDKPKDGVVEPVNHNTGSALDANEQISTDVQSGGDVMADAAAVTAVARSDDEKNQRLAQCVEFSARRKWQDLVDCAAGIEALGLKDKAKELRTRALQETRNEAMDGKIRQAVRAGSLKEAQLLLRDMNPDSVYHDSLRALVEKADLINIEDARKKVNAYLASHDCAGLNRYLAQQRNGTTGTEQLVRMVGNAVDECITKAQPDSVAVRPTVGKVDPRSGKADSRPGKAEPHESRWINDSPFLPETVDKGLGSATTSDSGSGSAQPAVTPTSAATCDPHSVDEAVANAAVQYNNGHSSTALSILAKALNCKQSIHMFQLAALYACGARDVQSAKLYFSKIPPGMQSGIEQRCQQEGLNVRSP